MLVSDIGSYKISVRYKRVSRKKRLGGVRVLGLNALSDKAWTKRAVSWVFAVLLASSLSGTALAAGDASMQPVGGSPSSGAGSGNGTTWFATSQFLRISVQWVPKDKVGEIEDKKYGLDWSEASGPIIDCGTFDWALGNGSNPKYTVNKHTGFKSAYQHFRDGYTHGEDWKTGGYYTTNPNDFNQVSQSFALPMSSPLASKFPRPISPAYKGDTGGNIIKDMKGFFQPNGKDSIEVANQVAWMMKRSQGVAGQAATATGGLAAITASDLIAGVMKDDDTGEPMYGGYVVTVEPGIYTRVGKSGDNYTAATARDIYTNASDGVRSTLLSGAGQPVRNTIVSIALEPDTKFPKLGLEYKTPFSESQLKGPNGTSDGYIRNGGKSEQNWALINKTMAIGTVVYTSKEPQLPAIYYYYDLSEAELNAVGLEIKDGVVVPSEGTDWTAEGAHEVYKKLFSRAANKTSRIEVKGAEHTAPLNSEGYGLIEGYMTNKEVVKGNLDKPTENKVIGDVVIPKDVLQFFDMGGLPNITPELKQHTKNPSLMEEDVVKWGESQYFATLTPDNIQVSKLKLAPEVGHIQNVGNGLKAVFGEGKGKLQSAFLYVRVQGLPVIPGNPSIPAPPDTPSLDREPVKSPTHVTKMFYEKDNKVPTNIKVESISKDSTYDIKDTEDGYKLNEWVIVDDKNGPIPGGWKDYDTAKQDKTTAETPGEGTTAGSLGPQHWSNPDRELVIKYEKGEEDKPDVVDADLYLSEKRITWLKSLNDIGGVPNLNFKWEAVSGTEMHGLALCHEKIDDGGLFFVTSNQNEVKADIMGNVTYFKPYDSANTYQFTRGNPAGSKVLSPNYHWVIWRGKDKPTAASYKYDGSTLGNTIPDKKAYNIISGLIGNGKVPKHQRHPANSCEGKAGYYMDGIKIKMGAVDKDTGLDGTGITPQYNIADWEYNTKWSFCGKTNTYQVPPAQPKDYNASVRVDVGYGKDNTGDSKVTFKSQNLNAFGIEFNHVQGFPVNNTTPIKMYPYVEMLFDTTAGLREQKVMALGGHESKYVPNDYVEIGYKTYQINSENKTGLALQSKQWSVHEKAKQLGKDLGNNGKNKVLPGGAVYRLTTPSSSSGNTRTKVGMSSWLTFIPEDTIQAVTGGADKFSGTAQNNRNEELYREVLNSFNNLDIIQIVNNEQVLQEKAGIQKVNGTSGEPTSKYDKYWLKQNLLDGVGKGTASTVDGAIKINSKKPNEADLDIITQQEERIYYRIYSDTEGKVYVSKGDSVDSTMPGKGTILGTINKGESAEALISKHTEIKALNNRTNLVVNYINAIDRNMGNDRSGYGTWYNEAFDGICVVRVNKLMELGFKDNGESNAARVSAIDPKLSKPIKDQSNLFSSKSKSWFETDKHTNVSDKDGYVGTFTGADNQKVEIEVADMNGLYRSKDFYIPNGTVMNLY